MEKNKLTSANEKSIINANEKEVNNKNQGKKKIKRLSPKLDIVFQAMKDCYFIGQEYIQNK